jgi:hypothetical protein
MSLGHELLPIDNFFMIFGGDFSLFLIVKYNNIELISINQVEILLCELIILGSYNFAIRVPNNILTTGDTISGVNPRW